MAGIGRRRFLGGMGVLGLLYAASNLCDRTAFDARVLGTPPETNKSNQEPKEGYRKLRACLLGSGKLGTRVVKMLQKNPICAETHRYSYSPLENQLDVYHFVENQIKFGLCLLDRDLVFLAGEAGTWSFWNARDLQGPLFFFNLIFGSDSVHGVIPTPNEAVVLCDGMTHFGEIYEVIHDLFVGVAGECFIAVDLHDYRKVLGGKVLKPLTYRGSTRLDETAYQVFLERNAAKLNASGGIVCMLWNKEATGFEKIVETRLSFLASSLSSAESSSLILTLSPVSGLDTDIRITCLYAEEGLRI